MKAIRSTPSDLEILNVFKKKYPYLIFNGEKFWNYESGIYSYLEDEFVRNMILKVVKSMPDTGINITANKIRSIYNLAKTDLVKKGEIFDQNRDILVFQNKALNLKTMRVVKHSPKFFATYKIPYDYDPSAKCPNFLKLVSRFEPEVLRMLQEYAGHCIGNEYNHEVTLWLLGSPGVGKSTFLEGLKSAFGEYMQVLRPKDFVDDKYFLSSLRNVRILYSQETVPETWKDSSIYTSLISEEEVVIKTKYEMDKRKRFHFRFFLTMNILPNIFYEQDGLWRRLEIIRFPDLNESERDRTLKEKIKSEGPGIMIWALGGLRKLRKRGYFLIPDSVKKEKRNLRKLKFNMKDFTEISLAGSAGKKIQASELDKMVNNFCAENNFQAPNARDISTEIQRQGFKKSKQNGRDYYLKIPLN